MRKKRDRCAVFGCNNDFLFSERYPVKSFFCPKSHVILSDGHPIILLKSSKFNMAAVSVKRSIPFSSAIPVYDGTFILADIL